MNKDKKPTTMFLDAAMMKRVRIYCATVGTTIRAFIESAIAERIERLEKEVE